MKEKIIEQKLAHCAELIQKRRRTPNQGVARIDQSLQFTALPAQLYFHASAGHFQIAGFANIRIQQIGPILIHHSNAGNRHRNATAGFFERLNRRHVRNLFQQ